MRVNMNKWRTSKANADGCQMAMWCLWYRGVGSNFMQGTSCQECIHRKHSGIKGIMSKVMRSFICRGCLNPVTSTGCTSVDIGVNSNLELLTDKLCYLGDTLSVDVKASIRIGWSKFRQLVPLLANKDTSLIMRGRLCRSCV